MNLTAILLLATSLHVMAKTFSQKVTISAKNAPVTAVFKSIEKQTNYQFFYTKSLLKNSKPVNLNLKDEDLNKALELCLAGQNLSFSIEDKFIVILANPPATSSLNPSLSFPLINLISVTIQGRVINDKGEPLVEASIQVKGTNKATGTDEKGSFVLNDVTKGDILLISYVGYETRSINITDSILSVSNHLIIHLKSSVDKLNEVEVMVNTGLQKLPKERSTGSFALINNKLFNEQIGTNVLDRLQYVTNGYTSLPLRTSNHNLFVIRGLSTFNKNLSQPLIILDNFEYKGNLNNINPNDIESVTFLKDAAAGSIWGAKAGNGVIVITSKKSKFNQETRVNFTANTTMIEKPDLFYTKRISSSDYIDLEKQLFAEGYYDNNLSNPMYYTVTPVVAILDKVRQGVISQQEADDQINALRNVDLRQQYSDYVYQPALNQQYSLSVNGGTQNLSWMLSTGIDKNIGSLDERANRFNFRSDNVYAPVKGLEIGMSFYYTQASSSSGRVGIGLIRPKSTMFAPYTRFADENGDPLPADIDYTSSYTDTAGAGRLLDWRYYQLDDYRHNNNKVLTRDLNAVFSLKYRIHPMLTAEVSYRNQRQTMETDIIQGKESYFTRNLINSFTQINGDQVIYNIPVGGIRDNSVNSITTENIRGQLNFNMLKGEHSLAVLMGSEISESITENTEQRVYGYDPELMTSIAVDYVNPYPDYVGGWGNFIPQVYDPFTRKNNRLASFYGNGAYTFKNRYTLSASARRDASNIFGVKTNDKWKPLWSAGASWDVSRENFYEVQWLPLLKLKITYGYQGNFDPSMVSATTIGYGGNNYLTNLPFADFRNYSNPTLRWEQVAMLNTAIEWSLKNRRLSGTFEYYRKKMTDLLSFVEPETTLGVGFSLKKNVGNSTGHGIDLQINSENLVGKFRWSTDFIFNTYRDKVIVGNPIPLSAGSIIGANGNVLNGYGQNSYFAYRWAGLDPQNGDPQGYVDGKVSKDYEEIINAETQMRDVQYIGSLFPRIFGSIGNTFSYKGFSLSARITYRLRYYFQRESVSYESVARLADGHSDYALRWQSPGDELTTSVPSFAFPFNSNRDGFYEGSELLATKGDHIRLQYVNLGYDFNPRKLGLKWVRSISLVAVANNLGILWRANKFGLDPETSNSSIPPPKNLSLGIRLGL